MEKLQTTIILLLILLFITGCSSKTPEVDQTPSAVREDQPTQSEAIKKVIINERQLTQEEQAQLEKQYGIKPQEGEFWYDTRSGLQGKKGEAAAGYLLPGHNFGQLRRDASKGNTGIILNGRELPEIEVVYLERILQMPRQQGSYWLDAQGNLGFEGNPQPFANVYSTTQSKTTGSDGGYVWSSATASGGGDGSCSYVNLPSGTGVSAGFVSTC